MALRPFMMKVRDGIVQSPQLGVSFVEVHVPTGKKFAGLTEVKQEGWDKSRLVIRAIGKGNVSDVDRIPPVRGGGGTTSQGVVRVDRSTRAVKKSVRRITDEDALRVAAYDERIAALEDEIKTIRRSRKLAVDEAWRRGKEIFIADLEPQGDANHRTVTG